MNELDLDINNYNLNDLLSLFKLNKEFNQKDLKQAKKIVLATHPDKSNLKSEYFLFFAKAYKILVKIYNFNNKNTTETDYNEINKEINSDNKKFFDPILKKDNADFNVIFNKMFDETINIKSENGYGNWLSSDSDIETRKSKSLDEMNELINEKKQTIRSLTKYTDFNDMKINNTDINNINQDEIQTYSSDIFSKFQYEDLKKAHTETVIPVIEQDYKNKKQYNVDEYKTQRNHEIKPLNADEINDFIRKKELNDTEVNNNRAYTLIRQNETYKDQQKILLSKVKQITQ